MLYFYTGTDTEAMRAAARAAAGESAVRITDAHSLDDARAALQGGGMFMGPQVVVFDRVFGLDETATKTYLGLENLFF